MKNAFIRRLLDADFQNLLDELTSRQHLSPHEPLDAVLARTVECLGVCPVAIEQATKWLSLDGSTPIGRLRRTELTQLARSVHRFWREQRERSAQEASAQQTAARPATH
jgi:hypothetical protein